MKLTIDRDGWSSKRIVQLVSIPHSRGIDLVSDRRNCTICELVTTFISPEPKPRRSIYGNGSIVHYLYILRYNILSKTIGPIAPKRCSNHILSIVIQNYSLVIAHISTSACGYYIHCCFLIALILLLLPKYY